MPNGVNELAGQLSEVFFGAVVNRADELAGAVVLQLIAGARSNSAEAKQVLVNGCVQRFYEDVGMIAQGEAINVLGNDKAQKDILSDAGENNVRLLCATVFDDAVINAVSSSNRRLEIAGVPAPSGVGYRRPLFRNDAGLR